MQNRARESTKLTVSRYLVRDWPDNPKRRSRESKVAEREMTDAQRKLWGTLCDPLTTDEPLRLAMLDAALRVKHDHMRQLIKSLDLSEESEVALERTLQYHRETMLTRGTQ